MESKDSEKKPSLKLSSNTDSTTTCFLVEINRWGSFRLLRIYTAKKLARWSVTKLFNPRQKREAVKAASCQAGFSHLLAICRKT